MSDALFDYFSHVDLPTPILPASEAETLLAAEFGVTATLVGLGSQQDQNFIVRAVDGDAIGVLKISNPVFSHAELELQALAAATVAEAEPGLRIPRIVQGPRGPLDGWWETSQGRLHARVIEFVAGSTLTGSGYLSPRTAARMGELAGRVSRALAGIRHPAAARVLQWDLQHAERVIDTLLPLEPDEAVRSEVAAAARHACEALAAVAGRLPRQLGHFDITDDNVLRPHAPTSLPDAVIDFGDVLESWAVGEIAVTVSSLLHHDGATPLSALPAIRAFHTLRPLSPDEADALWPLVVLRGAVLVLSGRQQVRLDEANDYASGALDREYRILEQARAVPIPVMARLIRDAIGLPVGDEPRWEADAVLDLSGAITLDAGTTSPLNDDGAWLDAGTREAAAQEALDAGAPAAVLPFGSPVLTGAPLRSPAAPATVPTATTIWLSLPTPPRVPDEARIEDTDDGFAIVLGDTAVRFRLPGGSGDSSSDRERTGERTLPARTPVRVQVTRADEGDIPELVVAAAAEGWRALAGDPASALGLLPAAPAPDDAMEVRSRVLAEVQEHYYADPPRIERGWRENLIDTDGRVYLDMVNNVTAIGHAHPRVAAAASRQLRLLNTNSRFHYGAIAEYADRLASTLPDELDTVFLVNSGSEATDLAIRLAMAATGRRDIVAMREAYHGWTFASDAVSTSIADNPFALETRPDWVHTVDAANGFRGRHRGADAAKYASEAAATIRALAADGRAPAGFICESLLGNAGGITLPDGYLREVYAAVREVGGLAIADEVQVGFGRLGTWFWGFQQQDAVPDIVAVAKSIGNGHPVGAVVTRREIADRYRTQGYFFSSTGGSPVSSRIALTVLDVIEQEGLQHNAAVVGAHLKRRLEELGERHRLVGTVHGSGLYLGLEFVRDRETLEPATEETAAICDRLLELGVIMQPTGDHQNVLKIKPPLCVTTESADYFVDALDRVLQTGW